MNFNQLLQQAQTMQKKAAKQQAEFDKQEFEITSQNNYISGTMTGNLQIQTLTLSDDLLKEDKENIEAMITISVNQTIKEINKMKEETLKSVTNGIDVSAFL